MIEIKNATKIYKSQSTHPLKALDKVNLSFGSKGLVFIHGKSGSGKTTLLSIMGGLDNANSSKIIFDGIEIRRFNDEHLSRYRNQYIGFIFQAYHLISDYTVFENVELPLRLQKKKYSKDDILKALKDVELEGLENRKISELSGGQKQRVAIARALIKDPAILCADEPTGNLDSQTSIAIFNLLKKFSKDRLVLVVSHDTEYAHQFADRIIEIADGKVLSDNGQTYGDDKVYKTFTKAAKLPLSLTLKLGIGNLIHNKIRILVSAVIVAFLVAILSSIYTSLYATAQMNAQIIELSQQDQILITETYNLRNHPNFDPTKILEDRNINSIVRAELNQIANENQAQFFSRSQIIVNDQLLSFADIKHADYQLEDWMIQMSLEDLSEIDSTKLSFTSANILESSTNLVGQLPINENEIIVSSQLLDLFDLELNSDLIINNFKTFKIVGYLDENVVLMPNENIALLSNIPLIYTTDQFISSTDYTRNTQTYGIRIIDKNNLTNLLLDLEAVGKVKVLPANDLRINTYTRYQLTLLMGMLIPLMGYIALIFLGYSISHSIAYRRKTIGILRSLGLGIHQIQKIFWIEAIVLGFMILGLVIFMVPSMLDILNFAMKMHFIDTHIFYTNIDLFYFGMNHVIEVFFILMAVFLTLVFTLTHHINLLDPAEVIRGR